MDALPPNTLSGLTVGCPYDTRYRYKVYVGVGPDHPSWTDEVTGKLPGLFLHKFTNLTYLRVQGLGHDLDNNTCPSNHSCLADLTQILSSWQKTTPSRWLILVLGFAHVTREDIRNFLRGVGEIVEATCSGMFPAVNVL